MHSSEPYTPADQLCSSDGEKYTNEPHLDKVLNAQPNVREMFDKILSFCYWLVDALKKQEDANVLISQCARVPLITCCKGHVAYRPMSATGSLAGSLAVQYALQNTPGVFACWCL